MRRARLAVILSAGLALVAGPSARAEHFDISLSLQSSKGIARAEWDTSPPEGGFHPREKVTAAVGEEVLLEWRLRSEFPHGIMKKVTIRIFVAPEGEAGQKPLPGPNVPRVMDNAFTADFLPSHASRGHVRFRVSKPGAYLVRLQSEATEKEHGHEHFAALDLVAE